MKVSLKITNQKQYDSSVNRVELDDLKVESNEVFTGFIEVVQSDNSVVPFFGLIEARDFEDRFGFILTAERVSTFSF